MSTTNIEEYFAGDTMQITFAVKQADGTPQDLTNCSIVWGVSKARNLTAPILTKSVGNGVVLLDELNGLLVVTIDKGEIPITGELFQELEITLPSGRSYTFAQGTINSLGTVYPN